MIYELQSELVQATLLGPSLSRVSLQVGRGVVGRTVR